MEGIFIETENMLAHGRMDLPLSLCFAAHRADDLLLHQLLKRGLDPNESDNNGRTPLVCETISLTFAKIKFSSQRLMFSFFLSVLFICEIAYSCIKRK